MERAWRWVAEERRTMADLGDALGPEQLATPSLCAGWTVRDVLAHVTLSLDPLLRKQVGAVVRAGFRLPRAVQLLTADRARLPTSELTGLLRRRAEQRWAPPGFGPEAPLTDLLVHGVDIRRPLGLVHAPDLDAVRHALEFVVQPKASRGFTSRRPQRGLRFEATDVDWAHGAGPVVAGPALPLVAALCGRPAVLDDLDGDGVAELRERLG